MTLLYVSGVLWAEFVPLPVVCFLLIGLIVSGTAIVFEQRRLWFVCGGCVLAGAANLAFRTAAISPFDLRNVIGEKVDLVRIQGRIAQAPVYRLAERNGKAVYRSTSQVEVELIRRRVDDDWQAARGLVAVSTPGLLESDFFTGRKVELRGLLRVPPRSIAEGMFDYRTYLKWNGIYYQVQVESTNDWSALAEPGLRITAPFSDRFSTWARATLAKGLPGEDEPLRLLQTMALGWKTGLTDEVAEPFMHSGTLHVFAISGLHVALIAGILVSLLRVLQVPRWACGFLVIPLLWFYTAATGWQASAIRSTIMSCVVIAGWSLRRPSNLLNSLAASSFIILVWEPRQLFQASFQLSFFVVLSIALFLPPLEKLRQRLLQTDPFLPPDLRPRWQQWLDDPLHYVTTSVATSLAAWLGSLPLIAYYFHLVTPVSLPANLLIVPLSAFGLMSCLGSLICGDWLTPCTVLFNHSAWFWMFCMIEISRWAATLPGAYFYIAKPGLVSFGVYYLLLVGLLSGWLFAKRWRLYLLAAFCFGLMGGAMLRRHHANRTVHITVPPLGGSGIFCDLPGHDSDLLIDPGSASAAEFVVEPFLRAHGLETIPILVLSHGDLQHVGGFDWLNQRFTLGKVITSSARFRSAAYRKIIGSLQAQPERWRRVNRGQPLGGWFVLHPSTSDRFNMADDGALVLYREVYGVRILFLSDLGKLGQRKLLEREPHRQADIVITGLPSSGEPLEPALLNSVDPRLVVIAAAEYPLSSQPTRALRARLSQLDAPVIYTTDVGSATITITPKKWSVRTMDGFRFAVSIEKSTKDHSLQETVRQSK